MTGGEIEFTPLPGKHPEDTQIRSFDYSTSEQDDLNAAFGSVWGKI